MAIKYCTSIIKLNSSAYFKKLDDSYQINHKPGKISNSPCPGSHIGFLITHPTQNICPPHDDDDDEDDEIDDDDKGLI